MAESWHQVTLVTMKRKHIKLTGQDKYGHWWFEIDDPSAPDSESYGWWPKHRVSSKGTLAGVAGELNGQTTFNGLPTRDPHHGDDADEIFYPWVSGSDTRTDQQIAQCLRSFSLLYNGRWRWTFGRGQNCHTFQEEAMERCKLRKRPPKLWL